MSIIITIFVLLLFINKTNIFQKREILVMENLYPVLNKTPHRPFKLRFAYET